MNENDIGLLSEAMQRRLAKTSLAFRRSLFGKIEWGDRLLCIKGPRGFSDSCTEVMA